MWKGEGGGGLRLYPLLPPGHQSRCRGRPGMQKPAAEWEAVCRGWSEDKKYIEETEIWCKAHLSAHNINNIPLPVPVKNI